MALQIILFCGDFRQCGSTVPRASKVPICSQSFSQSNSWENVEQYNLTIHERI